MKKTLLTLLSSIALFGSVNAQVAAYSFATSSSTYTPITGGSVLGTASNDEQRFVDPAVLAGGTVNTGVGFPIGFNFTYNSLVFDRVAVCSNGWITFGQSSLTPSVNISSADYYSLPLSQTSTASPSLLRNRIGGLALDLQGQTGSELRIQTIGSAPNRVCVVQWTNYKKFVASNGSYSFQIRLNETTNNIEVVYGTITPPTSQFTAQVGLSGTTASDFNIRKTAGSSWTSTSAGSVNTDTCRVSATIYPASGLVFAWTPPPPCSGTPVAGTASSSVSSVCSGISFDLTLTGYTSNASGITFQWQSSSSLGGTYTNISGATSATYSATQTTTTYYKCLVSCSGGTAVASNTVTVAINAPNACYCTPASGGGACITNVTIGSLNKTSAACENAPEYYTSVPVGTATTTINQATTYPISVTNGTGSAAIISVWIDFNQNGTFESSEWSQVATNATASSTSTVNVVVPSNATLGQTGMRVRSRAVGSPNGATDACTDFFSGEVEDYVVTIGAGTPCTGTPVAGTASSSKDSICVGVSFDLMLTGYTNNASGITFQWQSSSSMTGTFTNISGATTAVYTVASQSSTTYYKCIVTCSGSSATASSNVISVSSNPPMDCYCESSATSASDEDIFNVTVGTLNNTSSCTTTGGPGSTLKEYSNYTTTVAAPNLAVNSTVSFSVQVGTCGTGSYSNAIKIYIDYNQNGSFADAGEKVYASDTAKGAQTITGSFTVPTGASNGNTRMRIVCKETSDTSTISYCGTYTWGETEDYLVNITGGSNVGIEENEVFNNVSIYPNPSTGLFNIVATNVKAETITVQVIDLQGKVVYSASDKAVSASYNKLINLEGLAKGLYYIKLNSENGSKVQKIVIQ
jgi:hypothetical protein